MAAANGAPAAMAADHWQGRSDAVRQASAELPASGGANLPAGGAVASTTDRPLSTATDSTAQRFQSVNTPMTFDPLLPIDQTILPSYTPYALPVMSGPVERQSTFQPAGGIKLQPAGGIKLTNPPRP